MTRTILLTTVALIGISFGAAAQSRPVQNLPVGPNPLGCITDQECADGIVAFKKLAADRKAARGCMTDAECESIDRIPAERSPTGRRMKCSPTLGDCLDVNAELVARKSALLKQLRDSRDSAVQAEIASIRKQMRANAKASNALDLAEMSDARADGAR